MGGYRLQRLVGFTIDFDRILHEVRGQWVLTKDTSPFKNSLTLKVQVTLYVPGPFPVMFKGWVVPSHDWNWIVWTGALTQKNLAEDNGLFYWLSNWPHDYDDLQSLSSSPTVLTIILFFMSWAMQGMISTWMWSGICVGSWSFYFHTLETHQSNYDKFRCLPIGLV